MSETNPSGVNTGNPANSQSSKSNLTEQCRAIVAAEAKKKDADLRARQFTRMQVPALNPFAAGSVNFTQQCELILGDTQLADRLRGSARKSL